jgi:hypothetical protein
VSLPWLEFRSSDEESELKERFYRHAKLLLGDVGPVSRLQRVCFRLETVLGPLNELCARSICVLWDE